MGEQVADLRYFGNQWSGLKAVGTVYELCTTSYGLLELIKEMEGAGMSKVSQW